MKYFELKSFELLTCATDFKIVAYGEAVENKRQYLKIFCFYGYLKISTTWNSIKIIEWHNGCWTADENSSALYRSCKVVIGCATAAKSYLFLLIFS